MTAEADKLTAGLPQALRPAALDWIERFREANGAGTLSARAVELATVSEFAGGVLLREAQSTAPGTDPLSLPTPDALRTFVADIAASSAPVDDVKGELRRLRNRFLAALIAEDLAHPDRIEQTLAGWSDFASLMLDAATAFGRRHVERRFGALEDAGGNPVPLVILGMGKLGGGELNFSSDIDIVFLYPEGGESAGPKSVTAETWFTRLSQQIVGLIDDRTADGFVFRVDTRLRPFGDSGPPVTSFAALETYLLNHGRTWERYAYIKASAVGPPPPDATQRALFDELISPFVYRRYLDYGVFESLREMHALIAKEVERRELRDNLKLGPGGIREIEFIVQSMQLLRGGSRPAFATPSLLTVLPRLADGRSLSSDDCAALREAYVLLRRAENTVQAIRDQQVHDLPDDPLDQARLAFALGFPDWPAALTAINTARDRVREVFDSIAFGNEPAEVPSDRCDTMWQDPASASVDAEFEDICAKLSAFRRDPATEKADASAQERLDRLMPILLRHTLTQADPATTLDRVLRVVSSVLRRSAYFSLLLENPSAANRLVELCGRSRYIADELSSYPVLLDELLDARVFGEGLTRDELDTALAERLDEESVDDVEARIEALAQFQRATLFRIAVADFNARLPIMKVSDALTFLAEAVLEAAYRIAWAELAQKHGVPQYEKDGQTHAAGFTVIAYGKLGGLELSYGSDLDLVFLNDSSGRRQQTNGERPLDNAVFFSRLVRRLIHFLTTQTRSGVLYEIDTRLRPSGRKGLLVTTLDAFTRYQSGEAWTWEHQALLRARAVAGDPGVGDKFEAVRSDALMHAVRRDRLREDVIEMRSKMRGELDRSSRTQFDLKHGAGGLGDIEFLVQYLVLLHAAEIPDLIEFSDNIRQLDALSANDILDVAEASELQELYRRFRERQHHLALDDAPPLVPVAEFEEEAGVIRALWDMHFGEW